jgi:hypothetical protein
MSPRYFMLKMKRIHLITKKWVGGFGKIAKANTGTTTISS